MVNVFSLVAAASRASIEKEDLEILLPIIGYINPKVVLEIGMHQGYSMELWRKAFDPRILVGVEINSPTPVSYVTEEGMLWNADSTHPSIAEKVKELLKGEPVEFLFIDGDHSAQGVLQDYNLYAPLVRKGGVIVFHDVVYTSTDPNSPVMVKPLWKGLKENYPFIELKVGKNSTGIGVLFV